MNRLAVKLLGAFAAVVLVAVTVVTLVANRATAQEFEHFMFQGRMVLAQDMQTMLANYYARTGSWDGVQRLFVSSGTGMGMMGPGMMGSMGGSSTIPSTGSGPGMMEMMMASSRLQVVDASSRQVVADNAQIDIGRRVSPQEWAAGLPITVNGHTVGTLLVEGMAMTGLQEDSVQTDFLGRVNRAVFLAALAAGAVALVLGGVLVRQITAPLRDLTAAAGRIADGDLDTRVETTSADELGRVGAAFNQMAASLNQQEQLRRNLMADIAHELRTPISVIQGQVEALQDGIFPLAPDNLEPIHNNAVLLNRLVEDLRTLAHAEAGQLELDRQSVKLVDVVDDVVDDLRSRADAQNVELRADLAPTLPAVAADPQRLRQILLNLLSNALRHTPSGGVVGIQSTVNSERSKGELITDNYLLITVRDTGHGISPEDLPYVFDRFYRGDKSRSRQTGGMGLGLAIAKQLVELHGGHIWAESLGPSHGSTFKFTLPLD